MSIINKNLCNSFGGVKTRLLTGTALVAVSFALAGPAYAQTADFTLGANSTLDQAVGTDTSAITAGQSVDIVTFTLTIDNLSTVNDLGAVTGTTGTLLIAPITAASVTGASATSITLTGAGAISVTNVNDASASGSADFTVTGDTDIGGNLSVVNLQAGGDGVLLFTSTGALTVGGTITLTGVARAGSTTTATVTGNAAITGVTTITGSTGPVTLNVNGATNVFTGGVVLAGTAANAIVNLTPTAASTFTGTIDSTDATARGVVNVLGGANVLTFASNIGATQEILQLNLGGATAGNAVFTGSVEASAIAVLGVGTVASSADFNGNVGSAAFATGTIAVTGVTGAAASASFAGNVTVASITLDKATSDATATFDGTVAQTVVGDIVAAGDDEGVLVISNAAGVTFNDNIGVAAAGIGSITIASGASLTQKALAAGDDLTFDVVGNVDDGAAGTGGSLTIGGGAAVSGTAGDDITLATVSGNVNVTALTIEGGAAIENDAGGAVTSSVITGTTTATTYNITGGAGATDGAATGGAGGAVTTHLQTGAINVTSLNITGGGGGAGLANDTTGIGGVGGAVGAGAATFSGLVTGAVNLTGGNAGAGGAGGAAETGGLGGAGGAVTVTDFTGGIAGALTLTSGDGADGGAGGAATNLGGAGGAGGLVTLTNITAGTVVGNVTLTGGAAGAGGISGVAAGGAAGAGGGITATVTAPITGNLAITAAGGGTGGAGSGAAVGGLGGSGGTIAITLGADLTGNATIAAGAGGNGGAGTVATGGAGGAGGSVTATFLGGISGALTLDDGTAGTAGATGAVAGGAAGAAGTVTATLTGNAVTIGSVVAAGDGEGALVINNVGAGVTTFTGDVGSSTAALLSLTQTNGLATFSGDVFAQTITAGTADAANFDGDVTAATALNIAVGGATFAGDVTAATAFAFTAAGTMTLDGTGDQTITGAIDGGAAGQGDITVTNTGGTVTFVNAVGVNGANEVNDLTFNAATTTVFSSTVDADTITQNGAVTYNGLVNVDETLVLGDGSVITVGSAITNGQTVITAVGNITDTGTTTINMPPTLAGGTSVTVIDAGGGVTDSTYAVTDTALFDYTVTVDDTVDTVVVAVAARSTAAIAAQLGASNDTAAAFSQANTAVAADAVALAAFSTALNAGGATATRLANQVTLPADTLGATTAAAIQTGGSTISVVGGRQASTRIGQQFAAANGTGFSSGNHGKHSAFWAKGFGSLASQDEANGIKGFDADSKGMVFGVDTEVANTTRIGASFTFANTSIDGDGAGNAQNDIRSLQVTAYGDYTTDTYYIEGAVGVARNESKTTRAINTAGLNRVASGEFDGEQYMVSLKGGVPMSLGGSAFVTPTAGLSYTHVTNDSYTETGAGTLNLTVNPGDVDALVASLGAKVHTRIKQGLGHIVPTARFGLSYDLVGDEAAASSTFQGGGAAFATTGAEVEQFGASIGAGLSYETSYSSLGINLDFERKSDFQSATATLEARFKF